MSRNAWIMLAGLYTVGVLWMSWTPGWAATGTGTEVVVKRWLFNLLHPPVYAGMTVLWYGVVRPVWGWTLRAALPAAGVGLLVGLTAEIGQVWVPNRFPDVLDALLNLAGVGLGTWGIYYLTTGPVRSQTKREVGR